MHDGRLGYSTEKLLCPFEETLGLRIDVFVAKPGELLKFATLGGIETGGHLHRNPDMKVADGAILKVFHSTALEAEQSSSLGPRGNTDTSLPGQGWDIYFAPQCGLHKTDGNVAEEVVVLPFENIMRLDGEHNIQVTVGPSTNTRRAIATRPQARSGINPAGDSDPNTGRLVNPTLAPTGPTRLLGDLTHAFTAGTNLLDGEDPA